MADGHFTDFESHDQEDEWDASKNRRLLISVRHGVLLRVEAAAVLLGVGRSTVYDLIKRGELPIVKIGRRTLIHRDELERFAQARREA